MPTNAGPKTQAKFQDATTKIAMLRNRGLNNDADLLETSFINAAKSKNFEATKTAFNSLDNYFYKEAPNISLSGNEKEDQIPKDMSVIADRIQDALSIAEDSQIRLNPRDIQNAFEAELGGDTKEATRILKVLESDFGAKKKIQDEEERELVSLADGTQILIGKKTGTRYSTNNIPLSSGPINTSIYEKLANETYHSGPYVEGDQPLFTDPTGIQRSPEVYEQPVQQKPSRLQESIAAMQEAERLYQSGKKRDALAILNAMKTSSFMGGSVTMNDLERMYENEEEPMPDEAQDDGGKKTKGGTQYKVLD